MTTPALRADFAVIGLPLDAATSFRSGARFGPEAIRSMSVLLRGYHPGHDVDLFDHLQGCDAGDVAVVPGYVGESYERIELAVMELQSAGSTTVGLGGDHSVTLPELRAVAAIHGPVALVLFDAHTDTRDRHLGQLYGHGTVFRRAVEEELVDPRHSIQVGSRGSLSSRSDIVDAETLGFDVVTAEDAQALGTQALCDRINVRVAGWRAFLSFDVDVLDPAFAPGTGTPTVGGLTSADAVAALRGLAGIELVGMDVVEVAPPYDHAGVTALAAASVMWEALALLAVRKRAAGAADGC